MLREQLRRTGGCLELGSFLSVSLNDSGLQKKSVPFLNLRSPNRHTGRIVPALFLPKRLSKEHKTNEKNYSKPAD